MVLSVALVVARITEKRFYTGIPVQANKYMLSGVKQPARMGA